MKQSSHDQVRYIGFWPRALAQLVDNLLAGLLVLPGVLSMGWAYFDPSRSKSFSEVMYFQVLPFALLYLMWRYFQTSPGKYLIRAKIVDAQTFGTPTSMQLFIRLVGYVPSALALGAGFLVVLSDPRRQGWHDKMAGTVVVNADLPPPSGVGFRLKTPPPPVRLD
ncbi:MAG: hypothetical protein RIR70_1208 [Pseudomonadota bacterium]|jgi:uncharacterized RDD family membrane protein YckC